MSHTLKHRKELLLQKRSTTKFKDFIQEIASRRPVIFYKNQGMMSRYPDTGRVGELIDTGRFNENRDNLLKYGFVYNPDEKFFDQFQKLFRSVPLSPTIKQMAGENTQYADSVVESSHCYLSNVVINNCKNIFYSFVVFDSCENVFNSVWVSSYSQNIYECIGIVKSTNIFYSKYITNCSNIYLSTNLIGCSNCMLCDGLENQSYCYRNEQLTKEEYEAKKQELFTMKNRFTEVQEKLNKKSNNIGTTQSTGNHIVMSNDVTNGVMVNRLSSGRNVVCVGGDNLERNFVDVFDGGVGSSDMVANEGTGSKSDNVYCCSQIEHCSNIFYSFYLMNCSYCLGCVGLQNKSYCIFNTQYAKEEWQEKVNEIFTRMETDGELGKFFPTSLNPYYFNDTAASLLGTFTKEEITDAGGLRRDEAIQVDIPSNVTVVKAGGLGTYETDQGIDESIMKVVIQDEDGNAYRIIRKEYEFLVKFGLGLPRTHRLQRIKKHFDS